MKHTNPFTGQEYTSQEWWDYCRTHDTYTEVVHTDGKFGFNIHGVCVNTEEAIKIADASSYVIVKVAQSNGRWDYGLRYNLPPCYNGTSPVMYVWHKENGFAERDAAVIAGLDEMEKMIISWLKDRSLRREDDEETALSRGYVEHKLNQYLRQVRTAKQKIEIAATEPKLF